ncbi:MAG: prepilin-type N-terminal cleavage/methylation domain-containing protein [Planctomycetes bacterium]|nr:prepilin-type N-terminal cleavage/methylation domain-containing protein [Planctomycetota bacterium]
MELLKRAKSLYKALKERKGFTLPEVAAVVAITGTLAAIVVPVAIDQIGEGRQAGAQLGVNGIADAMGGFFNDTGEWPDRSGATPDSFEVLRSGNTNANFDLFGTPSTGNVADPDVGLTDWSDGTGGSDAFVNHLTVDNSGYVTNGVNWNGPYMPQVFNDPWGRNYLVYAKAFTQGDDGDGNDIFVWVISAGPNETLETNVTSPILNNVPVTDGSVSTTSDDVGKMAFRFREGVEGVQ